MVNYIEVSPDDVQPAPTTENVEDRDNKTARPRRAQQAGEAPPAHDGQVPPSRLRKVPPADQFQQKIPKYLLDLDQPEDSPQYQQAVLATEKLPSPPGLPGFLSKPILNAATQRKDDNSVLTQPNHTVLNHLATSSIKNNVLAVSATTRYKSKVGPLSCASSSPFSLVPSVFFYNLYQLSHTEADRTRSTLRQSYTSPHRQSDRKLRQHLGSQPSSLAQREVFVGNTDG